MITDALLFGGIVGSAFAVGAALSGLNPFGHKGYSAVMGFGAGLLLAAALTELVPMSVKALGLGMAVTAVLLAATFYSAVNLWLKSCGAEHRKRCGGCQSPPTEDEHAGSGASIAIGTVMDAFPEALVLGVAIANMGAPISLVVALFLGNAAQAMAATAGLRHSERSGRFIWGLWIGLGFMIMLATLAAVWIGANTPPATAPVLMAVAAGVLIAMIAEAMLPEASDQPAPFLGVVACLGVATFFALH